MDAIPLQKYNRSALGYHLTTVSDVVPQEAKGIYLYKNANHLGDRVGTRKLVELGSWMYWTRGEELKSGICTSSDIFELLMKYVRVTDQIRTRKEHKYPPRSEVRGYGDPPCSLRGSIWIVLIK